ncbi:MAG: B12-binding domain-containing radical SAM protein [Candidatus Moranbacteria bacterium RIFOXYC1_FULL_44_13]|nr:MAG: B12-binding domain-containing radical SAM protein [Candidatus Moranbacteria bacterium RIFOXYA1_FULL_44_7]OGI33464.1 MAG: B12-binding domain-containing radical SAM protein [Candidatus Moranbacteria bacterium RIFOXYC1_FULL_44_13]OGI37874.1 MAG: B12-binding domain-containing radical SAM protein [Candidatus Moranbacteria bacterium RIFOXYD1_FULL_44_12]
MKKIKISISYPPLESKHGTPLLSQNRQFQWFSDPTYIYPMIPASAATLLKENGYEVIWDDAIAEGLNYEQWKMRLIREKPDIVAIETKTPVIKRHWKIISELKSCYELRASRFVLMGDHVTALPEESLQNSKVDFVLAGGDYDFLLLKLLENIDNPNLPRIIRGGGQYSLDELPQIDRELTKWKLYAYKNGNYKYTPGAYVMNARDCWWGKCSFCSWTTLFPGEKCRTRSAKKALDEIGELIKLGAREIMEDSGTLPIGKWLEEFCKGMIERGYSQKVKISCNMRLNAIKDAEIYKLMKKAGFRMILFGFESANQKTLDRINKNLKIEEIEPALKMCKVSGLEPHITVMVGYPWETKKDLENTLEFTKKLFRKGYVDSLQVTLAIPYPGTPLYKYCQENNLLLTNDYSRFDQREPVMKTEMSPAELKKMIGKLYRSFVTPKFFLNKIKNLRSPNDLRFSTRAGKKFLGHLKDFS